MILLAALSTIIETPPPVVRAESAATVRIERPARVTADSWAKLPVGSRREIVAEDDQGRPILLRLVELP